MSEEQNTDKEDHSEDKKKSSQPADVELLGGNVRIDFSKPLDKYSNEYAKAFQAYDGDTPCFAIACDRRYAPRFDMSYHYQEIANPVLPLLITQGITTRQDGTPGSYCFIYKDNLGDPIYPSNEIIAASWKSDKVLEKIVIPIVEVLKDFHTRDLVHGNIQAANLFDGGKKKYDRVRLGECLSLPASMIQPAVYESIERAIADPIGRGQGTMADDLYALGVLIVMHLRSYDPLKGKSDKEIISSKIVHGSYSALVGGNDRFSGGVLELLRGLLIDDPKQRWTLDEVTAWFDGRRLSPKQSPKNKKASRPLILADTSYYYIGTLAYNLFHHPQEAVKIIENNELHHWVERTLADEETLRRLEDAVKGAADGGTGIGYWDRLIPRVSIALAPEFPIHYKGMAFTMDGLGNALADSFTQKRGLSKFTDLFKENILAYWISVCANLNLDVTRYATQIDKCRAFLRQNGIQFGIERCLYFLNNSIHCLSPIIEVYQARTPSAYLRALDDYAEKNKGKLPDKIIDKHAACFLVAREQRIIEPFAYDLSSSEYFRHILGTTQALSAIQKYSKTAPIAPHVTEWLVTLMEPVTERFHSLERQDEIRKELQASKSSGRIQDILDIVENPLRIRDDQLDFRIAFKNYQALENEKKRLEIQLKNPRHNAEKAGREWAATLSGIVSTLIILGFIMVQFGGSNPF